MDVAECGGTDTSLNVPISRWDDVLAQGLSDELLLLYRSNLLGTDLAITNFGGGNTSAKLAGVDALTRAEAEVLWVKGSGGDLGSMRLDGFATLYLGKLLSLEAQYAGRADEDAMVELFAHCAFNLNRRAPSIDTPLHGYLPFRHVDHVHPDALIALAASSGGRDTARNLYGDRVGWLEWQRPGFDLGLKLRDYVLARTDLQGVILEGHGLITWGDSSRACYETTLRIVADAARYLNQRLARQQVFGGYAVAALPTAARPGQASRLLPELRRRARGSEPKVGHFDDSAEVLEFVGGADLERLAALGTSCPDHFLRTKIKPLLLDRERLADAEYLDRAFAEYRAAYAAYYDRCRGRDSPPKRDANPVVVLVPGIGMFTLARDKTTARLASEFYRNAINVMRGAEAVGSYVALPEQEAFDIEYWLLEEAKLRRAPRPSPLAGRIALITGAAGGIGRACARRLMEEGACVVLTDVAMDTLAEVADELGRAFDADRVRAIAMDVTSETAVAAAFAFADREYGGVDILVANAGLASSASVEETTLAVWTRNHDVLARGYFLTAREAFGRMKEGGGSMIFIGSKNALAASANASAYASAKAAALHLARCIALEGAPHGIRVNTVNPDAVIRGSRIWDSGWREERARAHGIDPGTDLETFYRERSLLKRDVLPEDVAEAVAYLASDRSAKCTGNIINVDAGHAVAFTR